MKEPAAAADEHEQPAARVVVLRVRAQMLGELVDPLGEQRDLDTGAPGVVVVVAELRDELLLAFLCQCHSDGLL